MREIPWLTETATQFLEQLFIKNPNAKVLEFGCGGSTIWMSQRTTNLITIEHDPTWFQDVSKFLKDHNLVADIRLMPRPYNVVCDTLSANSFDLILVDGRDRVNV
jgi:predicted O-methyltransferase YrrM